MKELFFAVVTFIQADTSAIDRPLYILAKPNFGSYEECFSYVQLKNLDIYKVAIESYNYKKINGISLFKKKLQNR